MMTGNESLTQSARKADREQQLRELLLFVRTHSPYYQRLYQSIDADCMDLASYPILDLADFWQANSIENNQVLTGLADGGITFKSGGSTGNPKYSVFSNADWDCFTKTFGQGMRRSGLDASQPIGNLFYAGRLYASFLFITRSIEQAQVGMCYPIAGIEPAEIIEIWEQFQLTTFAGVPTTLMNVLAHLDEETAKKVSLGTFLYGGEPMFPDQVALLQKTFPDCQVRSIGIAGVDYGELGWACPSGELGVHHCFDESTILEIIDDEGQPIQETGVVGRLVLTNLTRRLMPVIRYPVGDQGVWVDPAETPSRRFNVLGRSHDGARVGPMTLYVEDITALIAQLNAQYPTMQITNFQIQVDHFDQRDCCTLRLVTQSPPVQPALMTEQVQQQLYAARTMFIDLIQQHVVHPLQVQWISAQELKTNPRTGKSLRIIDQRHA